MAYLLLSSCFFCRLHARLRKSTKTDPLRTEFHRAIIRWEVNYGSGCPGFVAESTGHQMSSRLLSMKSANALLELPPSGSVIPARTRMAAILIAELVSFPLIKVSVTAAQESVPVEKISPDYRVAILTVSDTVASGKGPDRR